MSKYVDADAFKTWIDEYVSVFKKSDKAEIKGYISHQPSIDIVWCNECVKRMREDCPMCNCCKLDRVPTGDNDYCSYGERRVDDEVGRINR